MAKKDEGEPKTAAYTLRAGYGKHYHEGELVEVGQEVQLTEAQAKAFADKFEPVKLSKEAKAAREAAAVPPPPPAVPTSGKAQDEGAKTPNPLVPNPNPGNDINPPAATVATAADGKGKGAK